MAAVTRVLRPRWIVTASIVVTAVPCVVAVGLLAMTWSVEVPGTWSVRGFPIAIAATCVAIGAVVVVRVPGNPIGWLFLTAATLSAVESACDQYATLSLIAEPGAHAGGEVAAWVAGWIWIPAIALVTVFLPLEFPNGRLLSRRWRPIVWLDVAIVAVATLGAAGLPGPLDNAAYVSNPFAVDIGIRPELRWLAYLPLIVAIFIGASALVLRFRRATGESRQQLKWLAFSVAVCGLVFWLIPLGKLGALPPGGAKLTEIVVTAGILGIPISAGIAVLRYRLWDIDRIVSRTISYLIVSAVLAALFAVTVVGLQQLLSPVTGQSTVAVAAATLVAITLFQPLRRRVQTAVDRRFNRTHVDAQRVLDGFAAGLRDDAALDALNEHLAAVVARSMQPRSVAVWTRQGGAAR
jgi:hypothetical protein